MKSVGLLPSVLIVVFEVQSCAGILYNKMNFKSYGAYIQILEN